MSNVELGTFPEKYSIHRLYEEFRAPAPNYCTTSLSVSLFLPLSVSRSLFCALLSLRLFHLRYFIGFSTCSLLPNHPQPRFSPSDFRICRTANPKHGSLYGSTMQSISRLYENAFLLTEL